MNSAVPQRAILAILAVVAVLLPFINKAFHIDDTLFLWMAQQISQHPSDPYGFSVNWNSIVQPMFSLMQNPPLSSYYAAAAGSFLGWSEPAMHCAFLLPAVAAIVGTFFLARRLSGSPLIAALFTLFTPVFLISATTIMCDVWLLALWIWSIECWLRGIERNAWWLLTLASVLAAAAALTKYFGISLVPLLAACTVASERRLTPRLLFLLIPLFALGGYEILTKAKYGHGMFSAATTYRTWTGTPQKLFLKRALTGLSFTGGCLIGALFYAPFLKPRKLLVIGLGIFVTFLALFYFFLARGLSSGVEIIAVTVEGALFATTAVGILALTAADVVQRRTPDSVLLGFWVFGTFFFATFLNWSVTSRTLLPMAPPVAILLLRRFNVYRPGAKVDVSTWWPLLPAAIMSLLLATADYRLANTARTASRRFQAQLRTELGTVWFQGHWGFQYYMEKWGAKPMDVAHAAVFSGDVIILPAHNVGLAHLSSEKTILVEEVQYAPFPLVTTMTLRTAGFYSNGWGPLPWALTYVPPERYYLGRFR
jgi:4-amino-4-deoxy-L-arabinose transferase-like glycosyltransferase